MAGGVKEAEPLIKTRGKLAQSLRVSLSEVKVDASLDEEVDDGMTWREMFYNGLAVVAIGSSAAAMAVEGSLLVNVVGGMCTVLGPAAAIKQRKISDMEGLRRAQNKLREAVRELRAENDRLSDENDRLVASTKKLRETEAALAKIGKVKGQNVDRMVKQLNEFEKLQKEIKENLEASVLQNLISAVVRSDKDGDFKIDPEEINGLIHRLANISGVRFNEKNFRKALEAAGYSLRAVIDITKNLLDDTVSDDDNIFVIDTNKAAEDMAKKKRKK